jgi:GrpB-like predicted nucleotidyltransferase (UPF0157 family)
MIEILEDSGDLQKPIGAYVAYPAVCRKFDPRVAEVARQIVELISRHLPNIHAEHVGSTSVPGCAGKGIVDLMIPVPEGAMDKVKEVLESLGFQRQTGPDPFPEERPMRVGAWQHDGERFLLHVHVIPAASPEVDDMRFFRACMRADPELVRAYVGRKKEIISDGVTDSLEYGRIKGEFLKAIFG